MVSPKWLAQGKWKIWTFQRGPIPGRRLILTRAHMAMGQNPSTPVNIPIPTKIGSKMGGAPIPQKTNSGFEPWPHSMGVSKKGWSLWCPFHTPKGEGLHFEKLPNQLRELPKLPTNHSLELIRDVCLTGLPQLASPPGLCGQSESFHVPNGQDVLTPNVLAAV